MNTNPSGPLCPFCDSAASYVDTVCPNCGGRLPWAGALDGDRRARIAAEKEAERAQKEAETARRDAELAQAQASVQFAAPIPPRWAPRDDATTIWAGCAAILFGVPLGCLGMILVALGLILGWGSFTEIGVIILVLVYWVSRAFR